MQCCRNESNRKKVYIASFTRQNKFHLVSSENLKLLRNYKFYLQATRSFFQEDFYSDTLYTESNIYSVNKKYYTIQYTEKIVYTCTCVYIKYKCILCTNVHKMYTYRNTHKIYETHSVSGQLL